MQYLNKVQLIGNICSKLEKRTMEGGKSLISFSVAVNEKYKNKDTGETKEYATFINCEVWGKLADILFDYGYKGQMVYVEGKWKNDSWEKEGVKKTSSKVKVDEIKLLSRKRDGEKIEGSEGHSVDDNSEPNIEDTPF